MFYRNSREGFITIAVGVLLVIVIVASGCVREPTASSETQGLWEACQKGSDLACEQWRNSIGEGE